MRGHGPGREEEPVGWPEVATPSEGPPERLEPTGGRASSDDSPPNRAGPDLPGLESVRFGSDGLVPAVVVDEASGQVLMLAYMDAEALEATIRSGEVHFHSRSRGRLWRKGETSGNVLRLRAMALDCDADALLVRVVPAGPACHRGTRSCFDPPSPEVVGPTEPARDDAPGPADDRAERSTETAFAWLAVLWETIASRAATRPPGSYTARLLGKGTEAVGRKVVEEAVEVLLAAKDDALEARSVGRGAADPPTRAALAAEAADLLYHLLVLLAERAISPKEVIEVLRRRRRP